MCDSMVPICQLRCRVWFCNPQQMVRDELQNSSKVVVEEIHKEFMA